MAIGTAMVELAGFYCEQNFKMTKKKEKERNRAALTTERTPEQLLKHVQWMFLIFHEFAYFKYELTRLLLGVTRINWWKLTCQISSNTFLGLKYKIFQSL